MKKLDWFKVILIVSLFGNILLYMNHKDDIKSQEITYELLNAYIYRDLAQLELTIQYQVDNNWKNETLVTQKLDDAIDTIILHHGMENDDDKKKLLWKLYEYLKVFKVGDEVLDVSLNDKQRTAYIHLGQKLRSSGWTYDVGYDTNWNVFASRVNELIAET
ncbi:hypothetical protein [Paenibacillus sp. L3-i20]|uniref:hypothetical protein n=1 Tax=Paenibacillus sp. L3-i20 TaxID=2905833 RepID=UPI001EE01160|nr:hypothetical protein [Paenibacillus sp. L3-i20]GKU78991.1 hypothetical protein L3i20_v233880 [Paenibacillus sp. L3-i20]